MEQRLLIVRGVDVAGARNPPKVAFRVNEETIDSLQEANCFRFKRRKLCGQEPPKVGHSVSFESDSRMAFLEVTSTNYASPVDGVMTVKLLAKTEKMPSW